jgi:hypothetical protein
MYLASYVCVTLVAVVILTMNCLDMKGQSILATALI